MDLRNQLVTGPGWTQDQICQKNELLVQIQNHNDALIRNRDKLASLQEKVVETNKSIDSLNSDHDSAKERFNHIVLDVKNIREELQIEEARRMKLTCEKDIVEANIKQAEEFGVSKEQELERLNETRILNQRQCENLQAEMKSYTESIRKLDIDSNQLSQELCAIRIANKAVKEENDEKLKYLKMKRDEIQSITKNSNSSKKEVNQLTEQVQVLEKDMKNHEKERDELKLKLDRLETVDLKAAQREYEKIQRTVEKLRREEQALERHSIVAETKSETIANLISAQEEKLMNLNGEIKEAKAIANQQKKDIERLKQNQAVKCREIETISSRYNVLKHTVHDQNTQAGSLETQIEEIETRIRTNHDQCSSIKQESNRESKQLHENQEKLEQLNNDKAAIRRQIKTCQFDMAKVESCLISDHFLHYTCDVESDELRKGVAAIRDEIASLDTISEDQLSEIQTLCDAIQVAEKDYDKLNKGICQLVTDRDSILSKLSHSQGNLATVQESLSAQKLEMKSLDKELHVVTEQLTQMTLSIQTLQKQIREVSDELMYQDERNGTCHDLENQLTQVQYQNKTLYEELNRPINIHRWRLLEQRDPKKYEKMLKIHKLQRKFIETSDEIVDLDRIIAEKGKVLHELKVSLDRIPHMNELEDQLAMNNQILKERMDQLKSWSKEIETHRSESEQLTKIVESIGKDMQGNGRKTKDTINSY